MEILKLIQGTSAWLAYRAECYTASETPILMGESPFMSRDDLLKYKTIGDSKEISRFQQIIFDKGHESEALARPLAELRCFDGDDLYPVTGLRVVDGLRMLASFDGLVMPAQTEAWEHKQFNAELYALVKSGGELLPKHYWQLEHQALVGELEKVVFTVSDGTEKNCADLVYIPRPERQVQLIAAIKQFDADRVNYVPIFVEPKAIAELIDTLPALTYRTESTSKGLSLISNVEEYKAACVALVERSKLKMETDQDFANAENRVKMCKEAEDYIASLQRQVLGEVFDIDKFHRDIGAIADMLRQCRLNEDKQVKQRKEQIRLEIITAATNAFALHVKTANEAIAALGHGFRPILLPSVQIDFVGAIKGKKTIKSLQEAANNELARAKIEANRLLGIIDANLSLLKVAAKDYAFLFSDVANFLLMDAEGLKAIAINRIAEHKQKEQVRIDAQNAIIAQKAVDDERKRVADEAAEAERAKKGDEEPVAVLTEDEYFNELVSQPIKYSGHGTDITATYQDGRARKVEVQLDIEQVIEQEKTSNGYSLFPHNPVESPVADDNGAAVVVGKSEIIMAVSKYWGISEGMADTACAQAFGVRP